MDKLEYQESQGLPNLGNTCYLNSIVQFLYASQQFRNRIETIQDKSSLSYCLHRIFWQMDIGGISIRKEKQSSMKILIKKIESLDKQINCHAQQDFFQILMLILNELFEENQTLEELFCTQTKNECNCGEVFTTNVFLNYLNQVCVNCQELIDIKMIKGSPLLIMTNKRKGKLGKNKNTNYLQRIYGDNIYRCIAKVFYHGDSTFGHYKTQRMCSNGKFIEFNDSRVYRSEDNYPLYLLYQKEKDIQKIEQKEINEVSQSHFSSVYADSIIDINERYCSQLNLTINFTETQAQTFLRSVYFYFIQTEVQDSVYIQMIIINKDQLVFEIPKVSHLYKRLNRKYQRILISSFLDEFEYKINKVIESFCKQENYSNQKGMLQLFQIYNDAMAVQCKDKQFTEVIRTK